MLVRVLPVEPHTVAQNKCLLRLTYLTRLTVGQVLRFVILPGFSSVLEAKRAVRDTRRTWLKESVTFPPASAALAPLHPCLPSSASCLP